MPALGGAVVTLVLFLVAPRGAGAVAQGGPAIAAWVTRPSTGRQWAPAPGEALASGDALRLQVSPAGWARVTLFEVDASGALEHLYSQQVTGTTTLPFTLALDEAPGPVTLYALFSTRPVPELSRELLRGERLELDGERIEVRKLVVQKR